MDCNRVSFLFLALLLLLLFPFPHFFLITLTYVWPKVTAGLHKWHIPYKPFRGQGCYTFQGAGILFPLIFPLPCWIQPSLLLCSILTHPSVWLHPSVWIWEMIWL